MRPDSVREADQFCSLLMCTIEFVVRGTLAILIGAVQTVCLAQISCQSLLMRPCQISSAITSSLNAIRSNIQEDIASANSVIASAVSAINKVTSLVSVNLDVPQFSIPALSALENVTIPTTFEDDLIKLNSSIPSLDELRDAIDNLIDTPFEALKTKLNATMLNLTSTFNASVLPVPEYPSRSYANLAASNSTSSDLCAGVDTGFLDDVAHDLGRLVKISIGLVILAAFIAWLAFKYWVWKKTGEQAEQVEMTAAKEGRVDGWQIVHIVEHPVLERYMGPALPRLSRRWQVQDNWRWFCESPFRSNGQPTDALPSLHHYSRSGAGPAPLRHLFIPRNSGSDCCGRRPTGQIHRTSLNRRSSVLGATRSQFERGHVGPEPGICTKRQRRHFRLAGNHR